MAVYAIQARFIGCIKPDEKYITIGHLVGSKKKAEEKAERERKRDPMSEVRVMYVRERV
jgi:hypothetical protein